MSYFEKEKKNNYFRKCKTEQFWQKNKACNY